MDLDNVFVDSRWDVIKHLSIRPTSPTELAKKTKTSLANISTQLRLLEALNIVEKQRGESALRGKPRTLYYLKKEFVYVVLATGSMSGKKIMKLNPTNSILFNIMFCNPSDVHFYLEKCLFDNHDMIIGSESFSFCGLNGNDIEILIVNDAPEVVRERLKDCSITHEGVGRRIMTYSHSYAEIEKGILEGNQYFISMLERSFILYDRDNRLGKLKRREGK